MGKWEFWEDWEFWEEWGSGMGSAAAQDGADAGFQLAD